MSADSIGAGVEADCAAWDGAKPSPCDEGLHTGADVVGGAARKSTGRKLKTECTYVFDCLDYIKWLIIIYSFILFILLFVLVMHILIMFKCL